MMKANPKESEGARLERTAFRIRLRRQIKKYRGGQNVTYKNDIEAGSLETELQWLLRRQLRYDKREGG
jgi:hypothetical protein